MAISVEIEEKIKTAPLLTETAKGLLSVCDGTQTTVNDLVEVVKKDRKLLKTVVAKANAIHFYRVGERVTSIEIAANLVGDNKLMNIIADSCPPEVLFKALPGYAGEEGSLWEYCLISGIASREIAQYSRQDIDPVTIYLAGLFHAMGKVIMSDLLEGQTEKAVQVSDADENVDFLEIERAQTGTDHCEVGGMLAAHWGLNDAFGQVLQFYHTPSAAEPLHQPLVYCVHVGSYVAMMTGQGAMADTLRYKLDSRYRDFISISTENFEHLVFNVQNEFLEIIKKDLGKQEKARIVQ